MTRQHFARSFLVTLLLWATGAVVGSGVGVGDAPHRIAGRAGPSSPRLAGVADSTSPPASPVKLVFVHHSTGGNWLADPNPDQPAGGLGRALMNNNYFVSATNYGWGPDGIGDRTDIPNWPEWFTGPNRDAIVAALYAETGQNLGGFGSWPRLSPDPGGQNQIILFKSCFPNSDLYGQPNDPPLSAPNEQYTVANAKAVYNNLLDYFRTRQDKLFVVITAPPMAQGEYQGGAPPPAQRAANARAFNDWLVHDWLDGYPLNNVAVFDYYNPLTSNGTAGRVDNPATSEEPNDVGRSDGNHHRWWNGAEQHTQSVANDYSAYPTDSNWDSHPTSAGHQKATAEFVPLLNVFYNRWIGGAAPPTVTATGVAPPLTRTATQISTATATETRIVPPTATRTQPAGQHSMVFQQGVGPDASYAGARDTILANDADANANLGGMDYVETFYGDGEEHRRSLLHWDLGALPGGITILSASVELYRFEGNPENAMGLALYRVTRGWTEGTGHDLWPEPSYVPDGATWTLAQPGTAWTTLGGDFDRTLVSQATLSAGLGNGWISLDATSAVRNWVEGGMTNLGLLLRPESGDYTYHYYHSREHNVLELRPRLVVNYSVGAATATQTQPAQATPTRTRTRAPTASRTATQTGAPTPTVLPGTGHLVYLPVLLKDWTVVRATATQTATRVAARTATPTIPTSSELVQANDLVYVGAFRLPGGDTPPQTFAYGGNAMTFNPDGDPASTDGYPGSLFVIGHDRLAYGGLPDGSQVAEVSIPVPTNAGEPSGLPQASFIQDFADVTAGFFTQMEEIPKSGMQYLNHADTAAKIHLCWGQHLQPQDQASHAWFNATLSAPNTQGTWFIADHNLYSTNAYMFDIPASWADANAQGRYLATGRFRDGGQGGMGPALFAYRPWLADGSAPSSGTRLDATTLLLYENAYNTNDIVRNVTGYQHPDEWEGGAWITTPSGKSAVLFAGTKSSGTKYWYGYIHPQGPEYPCVDEHVEEYGTCRMADGSLCPPEDLLGCCDEAEGTCVSGRGWWSTHFDAQLLLYDPADLARVASGEIESCQPQPYAVVDMDEHLYLDPPPWDVFVLGFGVQRRYRIGAAAYDRQSGLLYVLELYADGAKPVVHVWRIA